MHCLVTGGGGFLGSAIVQQLLAQGHQVRTYQRQRYPSLESQNVEQFQAALAQQPVPAANSPDLAAVALRPHLIWGPGDPHLVPRILARARSGRLSLIGKRSNLVDSTYIDNAAHAHLLAAQKLSPSAPCAGK